MFKMGQSIRLIIWEDDTISSVYEMSLLRTDGKRDLVTLFMLLEKGFEAKTQGKRATIEFKIY